MRSVTRNGWLLAAEYKGTEVGAQAAKLLKELTPPPAPPK